MSDSRIEALRALLEKRPDDPRMRFGLALEYLNSGLLDDGVRELRTYLADSVDEGNAWGRLGEALATLGRTDEAREAYRAGIEAATRHGHPTMAEEFEEALADLES
jgi:predicted Zn-dependent protease